LLVVCSFLLFITKNAVKTVEQASPSSGITTAGILNKASKIRDKIKSEIHFYNLLIDSWKSMKKSTISPVDFIQMTYRL